MSAAASRGYSVSCLGVSHHSAPLALLERLTMPTELLPSALAHFSARGLDGRRLCEGAILSTCNRTEIYFAPVAESASDNGLPAIFRGLPRGLVDLLVRRSGLSEDELAACLFRRDGWDAAEHLFHVVCGLDSLIVGEAQIVGQVARAYAEAQAAGAVGVVLSTAFQAALRGGRRARSRIGASRSAMNAGSAAVARVGRIAGTLASARVAVVGTGEIGRIVHRSLLRRGAAHVRVVSRSRERAGEIAARLHCDVATIDELPELLSQCDILFSTTRAAERTVTAPVVRAAMERRAGCQLVLVDLGVPRTIDPAAASVPGVRLLDIDSLKDVHDERGAMTAGAGSEEERRVRGLIEGDLRELKARMTELSLRPVIGELWRKAGTIRRDVLARTRQKLPGVDDESWALVEEAVSSVVARLLHEPAVRLRAEAANGHAFDYADALRELFRLGNTPAYDGSLASPRDGGPG